MDLEKGVNEETKESLEILIGDKEYMGHSRNSKTPRRCKYCENSYASRLRRERIGFRRKPYSHAR